MAGTYPASGQDASLSVAANLASDVNPAILSPSAQVSWTLLPGLHVTVTLTEDERSHLVRRVLNSWPRFTNSDKSAHEVPRLNGKNGRKCHKSLGSGDFDLIGCDLIAVNLTIDCGRGLHQHCANATAGPTLTVV